MVNGENKTSSEEVWMGIMVLEDKFDFECGVRSKQLYKHIEDHLASYHSSRKEFGSPNGHSSVCV